MKPTDDELDFLHHDGGPQSVAGSGECKDERN